MNFYIVTLIDGRKKTEKKHLFVDYDKLEKFYKDNTNKLHLTSVEVSDRKTEFVKTIEELEEIISLYSWNYYLFFTSFSKRKKKIKVDFGAFNPTIESDFGKTIEEAVQSFLEKFLNSIK